MTCTGKLGAKPFDERWPEWVLVATDASDYWRNLDEHNALREYAKQCEDEARTWREQFASVNSHACEMGKELATLRERVKGLEDELEQSQEVFEMIRRLP